MKPLERPPPRAIGERVHFQKLFRIAQDAGVALVTDDPTGLLDTSPLSSRTPRSSLDRFAALLERQRDGEKLLAFIEAEQQAVPGSNIPLSSLRSGFSSRLRAFLADMAGQSPASPPEGSASFVKHTAPPQPVLPTTSTTRSTLKARTNPPHTPPPSRSRRRQESQPSLLRHPSHGRARTAIPTDLPSSLPTTVDSQMSIDEDIATEASEEYTTADAISSESSGTPSSDIDAETGERDSSPDLERETVDTIVNTLETSESDRESAFSPMSSERDDSPTSRRPVTRRMASLPVSTKPSRQARRGTNDNSDSGSGSPNSLPHKRASTDEDDELDDSILTISSGSFDCQTHDRPRRPSWFDLSPTKQRKVDMDGSRSPPPRLSRQPPSSRPPPLHNLSSPSGPVPLASQTSPDPQNPPQSKIVSSQPSPSGSATSSPRASATPPVTTRGAAARRAAILAAFDEPPSTPASKRLAHSGATKELNELALECTSKQVALPSLQPTTIRPWHPSRPLNSLPSSQAFLPVVPPNQHQRLLNSRVVYGVQWELERQLPNYPSLEWDDLTRDDLCQLGGPASVALPKVAPLLKYAVRRKAGAEDGMGLRFSLADTISAHSANATTAEMDAEEDLIRKGNQALTAFNEDNRLWNYGGRLVYSVNVVFDPHGVRTVVSNAVGVPTADPLNDDIRPIDTPDNPMGPSAAETQTARFPFRFELRAVEPPTKSTHLARRFGSRRLLTLRLRDLGRDVRPLLFQMLLGRGLVLFGRVFRVLWVPPDAETAIAVQTDEVPPGLSSLPYEEPMPSFTELISRYNDLEAKKSQAIAKWSSRFQLLTSDSVPGVYVPPGTITVIPDIVSDSALDRQRPSTVETLTDGCGLMSEELARRLMLHPSFKHLTARPCVVQVRLRGAKGLLAIMSPEQGLQYEGMDVVLRDSMVKCPGWTKSTDHDDFSLSTLDVLRVDGLKIGSSLGSEAIIIMQHNGIPVDVLLRKSEQSLESIGQSFAPHPLATESEAEARQRLISTVYSQGGVGIERRKREARQQGLSTRVAGLDRSYNSDLSSSDGTELEEPEADQGDQGDNKPARLAERLYECLLAGFRPVAQDSALVASNLRSLVITHCDRAVADFKISVEQSVTAFIVPDSLGVLAPDEIFVSFGSERPIDPNTGRHMHFLEGDCLLYRSPCKLPTDVRKFKAVVRKELFYLRDCIVLSASAACKVSPASFLGGGDYDGDTVTVIWDSDLVGPFRNAPDEIAATPEAFERENFIKEVTSVQEVLKSLEGSDEETRVINLQYFLLGAILDAPLPGLYSTLHDTAVYERGCGDYQTMRLARMFCHVLDARKSGLQVIPEILKRDRGKYRPVEWREQKKNKGKDSEDQYNKNFAVRPSSLPPFIMDLMQDAGKVKRAEVLASFPDPSTLFVTENTAALQEPYRQLWAQAQRKTPTLSSFVDQHKRLIAVAAASGLNESNSDCDDDEFGPVRGFSDASLASGFCVLAENIIQHMCTQTEGLLREINVLERHVKVVHKLWHHVSTSDDTESPHVLYERLFSNPDAPLVRQNTPSRRMSRKEAGVWGHRRKRIDQLAGIWRDRLTLEQVPLLVPLGRSDILAELKISCAAFLLSQSDGKRKSERRITNWLFDLDFATTCALKARTMGQTVTVPADIGQRLRPNRR